MKKIFTVVTLICLSIVAFSLTSCGKKYNPTKHDIFVGTYNGKISYSDNKDKKSTENGSVTVVKTGNDYYFRFSDGIEDLKGVRFKKEGDNRLVNIDFEDGVKYIKIDASSLTMLYTTDGKTWIANASR
ncbi:hypothetical protein CGC50_05900 [Capnocytophaga gingivalis]|uniref:Lipoprotein n=1 Tax=Capnocytophaga gingivalis TaxID=1017 RepID=A0A250FRQ6_9FLAO|nr:hypothetical protein [Capnocytophaga gingivalis]ATA86738.1 hypothetical protein CGC50_05900 [Capnocytophaga gingivalis]